MAKVHTYNCKKVTIALGNHSIAGVADGSFVSWEASGDGTTKVVGAYGEVQRSISPNSTYKVKLSLFYNSPSNDWLRNQFKKDREDSNAIFPILIKDLVGNVMFQAEQAWVVQDASVNYDLTAQNLEWEIDTAEADVTES